MTRAMEYMLTPLMKTVMRPNDTADSDRAAFAVPELQIPGHGMGFGDVVKRHHHHGQKQHGRNGADPVPVGGQ